ncbi:MAG TPA: flagellar hook-basal body complex protein [Candidatus Baltobacteraceae bacterium]|jgi:flagellar hook protein FlgE
MPTDSLFTAVSGLNAYQNAIDVISNNIANVGTTGFKDQNITFQDLLYQTQAFATAPSQTLGGTDPQNEGLGVKTATIDNNFSQGGFQTTGINTDLAINGSGFFILGAVDGSGSPVYTRDGHFGINSNGILYDPSSGLAVDGYTANSAGVVNANGAPSTIQIPLGLKSQAVGTGFGTKTGPTGDTEFDVQFGGNLDQTLYLQANTGAATPVTISTTVYDSLGNSHLINVTFTPVTSGEVTGFGTGLDPATTQVNNTAAAATSVGTEWEYQITGGDPTDPLTAELAANPASATGFVFYDQNGQFINTTQTAAGTGATHVAGSQAAQNQGNLLTIANWGSPANNSAPTTAATPAAIALSFADMSSLAGSSTATTVSQNGYGQGTLSNITIGQNGAITGSFSNGQSQTLAQLVLATFQNDQGLNNIGNSQFTSSANSGLAQINVPGNGQLGTIVSGSLEESNVDLSNEFVKMIEAQSAFTANSKSISVAQQNDQTVLNLIPGG